MKKIIELILETFGTTQPYYLEQQINGDYKKKQGDFTLLVLHKMFAVKGALAVYQKNENNTINWICFDFDIIKKNLEGEIREQAEIELRKTVKEFCNKLTQSRIRYLLEHSGNRGFHVWIIFSQELNYSAGMQLINTIIETIDLNFDSSLIALDRFPMSSIPSQGPGHGVKIPLSKHQKSHKYSSLLSSVEEIDVYEAPKNIDENLLQKHIDILMQYRKMSISELETNLNIIIKREEYAFSPYRISEIKVQKTGFTVKRLYSHWERVEPLQKLYKKLTVNKSLNHSERRLLVGILLNIVTKDDKNLGERILHEVFKGLPNYDEYITTKIIGTLKSFNFPSQDQIEEILGAKFSQELSIQDLIKICIPLYCEHKDATFCISPLDVHITQLAEQNYLLANDEVVIKTIVDDLAVTDNSLYENVLSLSQDTSRVQYYEHIRTEKNKQRVLYSLDAESRVLTSLIIKQLGYFLNFKTNKNSFGYIFNSGFSKGYIFKPWLYAWIHFLKNINEILDDRSYSELYIVKTDVSKFYDSIPHDNLKRMMLGGVNQQIDKKRDTLKSEKNLDKQYQRLIEILFDITKKVVKADIGLPQGPAYARFLAELYLDNLDEYFDNKLKEGDILFYQRYVDDIFFITSDQLRAEAYLKNLEEQLNLLGLELNREKTYIHQIKNFKNTFNEYRSQSKYAVDRVSKNFENSNDKQKDLAIQEFMKLLQSEDCNEDLAFIFSHLNGVTVLDQEKRGMILPAIVSGVGRGSLYKHLFTFVLEDVQNHKILVSVEYFNKLQSEVLTSVFIQTLETHKTLQKTLLDLFKKVKEKLTLTPVVEEHICFIILNYNTSFPIEIIAEEVLLKVLKVCDNKKLVVNNDLLSYLNTSLNKIDDLSDFIDSMYALSINDTLGAEELNRLAALFYAKLSSDQIVNRLTLEPQTIKNSNTVTKFYYLLCLFSASQHNKSIELLESMWKLCAYLYEHYNIDVKDDSFKNWAVKLGDLDISQEISSYIISSIVDGNIFRGLKDPKNIFEKYHSIFLVIIAFDRKNLKDIDFTESYERLKGKSVFYDWLIDRAEVSLFPSSKKWFEKNAIDNNVIFLKRNNEVLIRRPTNELYEQSSAGKGEYSDVIVDYLPQEMESLSSFLKNKSAKDIFSILMKYLDNSCENNSFYPNMFCNDNVLRKEDNFTLFSNELLYSDKVILENDESNVVSYDNNRGNFISCFLVIASKINEEVKYINETYLDRILKFHKEVDFDTFLKELVANDAFMKNCVDFNISANLLISYAIYKSLLATDAIGRLKSFDKVYNSFLPDKERQLYALTPDMNMEDETLLDILVAVQQSIKFVKSMTEIVEGEFLEVDIEEYKTLLINILQRDTELLLSDFTKGDIQISTTQGRVKINGVFHHLDDLHIVHANQQEIVLFSLRYLVFLQSSDHVYFAEKNEKKYIIVLEDFISKYYMYLLDKRDFLEKEISSLPCKLFIDDSAFSQLSLLSQAVDIVASQRSILYKDAELLLKRWLSFLPEEYHQILVTIIAAHCSIKEDDIRKFLHIVRDLIREKSGSTCLLKNQPDHNGTHRILHTDNNISRSISGLSMDQLTLDAGRLTIIVDVIISGTQFTKVLRYYLGDETLKISESDNFIELDMEKKEVIKEQLKSLKGIDICTVLYTDLGLSKIKEFSEKNLNENIEVNIINGTNIAQDALFSTTSKISNSIKNAIYCKFDDGGFLEGLSKYFVYSKEDKGYFKLDNMNLVTRYQSLPKKSMFILHSKLRLNPEMSLMEKVAEKSDLMAKN